MVIFAFSQLILVTIWLVGLELVTIIGDYVALYLFSPQALVVKILHYLSIFFFIFLRVMRN